MNAMEMFRNTFFAWLFFELLTWTFFGADVMTILFRMHKAFVFTLDMSNLCLNIPPLLGRLYY